MQKQHCSVSYHHIAIDKLDVFADGVRQGIKNNPTKFITPPVSDATFIASIGSYVSTRAAYVQGGNAQKPAFLTAKALLMEQLDETATYVDSVADGDTNVITAAGFVPTKPAGDGGSIATPLQPLPILLKHATVNGVAVTGIVEVEIPKTDHADFYGCIAVKGTGANFKLENGLIFMASNGGPDFGIDVTKSRKKKFVGLEAGVTYTFLAYAGNATGVSPLTNPQTIMAV